MSDTNPDRSQRIYFLDNLRTFLIFLVVLYHTGLVYESSGVGAYFWIVDDPNINNASGLINLIIDIIAMPCMFFIAGFFTPGSYKGQSAEFIIQKSKRLLLPWLIAVLVLLPVYKFIFLESRGLPQEALGSYLYFSNGIFSQSWLWFLPVLFLFNVLYLCSKKLGLKMPNISFGALLLTMMAIGIINNVSFVMFEVTGWTKTWILDFQNERLLVNAMMFYLGVTVFNRGIFSQQPKSTRFYMVINSVLWLPITLYIGLLIYSLVKPDDYIVSHFVDQVMIRTCYHLSLFALLYSLVQSFRLYLNRTPSWLKELNRNSYSVYIIHTIVIGFVALTLLPLEIPSVAKYLMATLAAYVISNLMASSYRKIVQG